MFFKTQIAKSIFLFSFTKLMQQETNRILMEWPAEAKEINWAMGKMGEEWFNQGGGLCLNADSKSELLVLDQVFRPILQHNN